MEQAKKDAGTIAALMTRLTETRLPRAKRLLAKVNRGDTLSENDIRFLKRVHEDNNSIRPLIKRNPEYKQLATGMIDLYSEIIAKGLENEKAR